MCIISIFSRIVDSWLLNIPPIYPYYKQVFRLIADFRLYPLCLQACHHPPRETLVLPCSNLLRFLAALTLLIHYDPAGAATTDAYTRIRVPAGGNVQMVLKFVITPGESKPGSVYGSTETCVKS
jgi:hypothetical protein